ncbi:MAG: penicillin acylase family protein [Desulfobulbaceae bacterium]|nr:penicillin acylase family protein [Desulfobulbaceae bacterium]
MFVSHSEFIANLNYTLVITTGAKDMAGIPMDSEYTWSFVFSEQVIKTTRDDKGVWFITGPDNARLFDIFEAMGYAVATDRIWQAELYRRAARGRLSEILGSDYLESDILARTIGYSDQEMKDGFNALDSEEKEIVNGYVAGFNRRIGELAGDTSLVPFEFRALGFTPADWEIEDVLAWMAFLQKDFDPEAGNQHQVNNMALYASLAATFPAHFQGMFQDLRWINDPDALTYIPKNASPRSASEKISGDSLSDISASDIPDYKQTAANMSAFRSRVVQNLKKINAYVKMGSYAWTIAGTKTASGNPIIYSGPQMGFSVPSIVLEGSIRAGGLNISGMTVTGIPGIIVGRTPHHAWSMQVANGHTTDYYIENPEDVTLHRVETVKVAGGDDIQLPVYRTPHGPVVNPMPYNPDEVSETNPAVSWKYSHWGYEFDMPKALAMAAKAASMDEFGEAVELIAASEHICYADVHGNIAYWMTGRDPVRPVGNWKLPQGFGGTPHLEWDSAILKPRSTDHNAAKGFYGGWNNKDSAGTESGLNASHKQFGPYHRAHVVDDYLSGRDNLTFEEIRDLAVNIATTYSIDGGGNPWKFVKDDFAAAVTDAGMTDKHQTALDLLAEWDGHFVAGGESEWAFGVDRTDAWILSDAWIREAARLTFEDELGSLYASEDKDILFNVILHALAGESSGIVNNYNWFQNLKDETAPQTADAVIVAALDNVLAELGDQPWGSGGRGEITYTHDMLGQVHSTPFAARSTYAHCVEIGPSGPVRIESMFPLGESGTILIGADGQPVFDEHFFSMTDVYDSFAHRDFPLFD